MDLQSLVVVICEQRSWGKVFYFVEFVLDIARQDIADVQHLLSLNNL